MSPCPGRDPFLDRVELDAIFRSSRQIGGCSDTGLFVPSHILRMGLHAKLVGIHIAGTSSQPARCAQNAYARRS